MRRLRTTRVWAVSLVFAGGTLGCAAREALSLLLPAGDGFPATIFAINLTGAFLLGLLLNALAGHSPDTGARRGVRLFFGTGVLGGYTTYSALATDTALLIGGGRTGLGILYAIATVSLGGIMTWLGMMLATLLRRPREQR